MRTSYQGEVKRLWGARIQFKNDGKKNKVVINLSEAFNGGEVSDYAWANVDATATANELFFKPWGGQAGNALATSDYFMIEEVAFFANADDAKAY